MVDRVVTKRGKPFQSALAPYEDEVKALKAEGRSVRAIAEEMKLRHGLQISHNAVQSFLKTHGHSRRHFLDGVPVARRAELLQAIKALWTHDSTAIEGNTLTLGDTMIVLQYGLTVRGKPLKDHEDVIAHASGVDRIQELVGRRRLEKEDVLGLHRLVISDKAQDIYKPIGSWKREDNGTYGEEKGRAVYMAYAPADDTPQLMDDWLRDFNSTFARPLSEETAVEAYVRAHVSFVRIHPFFDGNGRMARLLANLPVLAAGYPPIVIPSEGRVEYIRALWDYQRAVGAIDLSHPELLPQDGTLEVFRRVVASAWKSTLDLVAEARNPQGHSPVNRVWSNQGVI